jgi:hypothetical protein
MLPHLLAGASVSSYFDGNDPRVTEIRVGGGFPLSRVLGLSGFGVFGGIALFFPWQTSHAFLSEGWPCTVMELMITARQPSSFRCSRGALFGELGP